MARSASRWPASSASSSATGGGEGERLRAGGKRAGASRPAAKLGAAELLAGGALCWRSSNAILEPSKVIPLDPRRFRWPVEPWMTYEQLAVVLIVSRKRLYNLVALHKLERRIQWIGGGRAGKRLRITLLPPATCRELARLTGKPYLSTTAAEPT